MKRTLELCQKRLRDRGVNISSSGPPDYVSQQPYLASSPIPRLAYALDYLRLGREDATILGVLIGFVSGFLFLALP